MQDKFNSWKKPDLFETPQPFQDLSPNMEQDVTLASSVFGFRNEQPWCRSDKKEDFDAHITKNMQTCIIPLISCSLICQIHE